MASAGGDPASAVGGEPAVGGGCGVENPVPVDPDQLLQQRHTCQYCGKCFAHKWMRDRHLPTHTGERLFECAKCFRRFSLQASAARHVQNVHKISKAASASLVVKRESYESIGNEWMNQPSCFKRKKVRFCCPKKWCIQKENKKSDFYFLLKVGCSMYTLTPL